jgi:hypothetical protein
MVDINKLVDSYYNSNNLKVDNLFQLIAEQMKLFEDALPGGPAADDKTLEAWFPKPRITENFGKPETQDRQLIENFARNIAPGGDLKAKLAAINSVIAQKKEDATVGEILATMVVCEILYTIISHFTEAAGGFIFEGFLAGLFGGQSVQIQSAEDIPEEAAGEDGGDVRGKPITDVVLHGKHYSLKLLGEGTDVKGSFRNMVKHFEKYPHVIYLDARRIDGNQGLEFGEFTITLDGFLEVFVTPFLKTVYKKEKETFGAEQTAEFQQLVLQLVDSDLAIKEIAFNKKGFFAAKPNSSSFSFSPGLEPDVMQEQTKLGNTELRALAQQIIDTEAEVLAEFAPFTIRYAESKFENTKAEALFGSYATVEILQRHIEAGNRKEIINSLKTTPGYDKELQFVFTRQQAEKIANFEQIGTLMIGEDYMKNAWSMYADLLRETMFPVYKELQEFSQNVNNYFLGVTEEEGVAETRKQYAMDAIQNARDLQKATENAVEKIEN